MNLRFPWLVGLCGLFGSPSLVAAPIGELKPAEVVLGGPESTELDLWRPWKDAEKVFVMVGLPGGSQELFMVDTGASVSVISQAVADRIGLTVDGERGIISGLSGTVPWMSARIPRIQLGEFQLNGVEVAVGVPGVPEHAGALPVAGILGNNVWSNFVCVLDYPADVLELHLATAWRPIRRSSRLVFDGAQFLTLARVDARLGEERVRADVVLEIDSGAQDLILAGESGRAFVDVSTRGVEPVVGLGADLDRLPEADLLKVTRRVPVTRVRTGGQRVPYDAQARWLDSEGRTDLVAATPGLLGYAVYADYRVVLDAPHQRFSLTRSRREPRDFEAVRAWLDLVRERHGDDPAYAAVRARLLAGLDDLAGARAEVDRGLQARPDDPELAVLLARVLRHDGDHAGSLAALGRLTPAQLMEEDEWIAYINSLVLVGRIDEAVTAAQAAVDALDVVHVDRGEYLIAVSDALVGAGRTSEAAAQLDEAGLASQSRSAHLLRRARIAEIDGDRYGAIVPLQHLIRILPIDGRPMWLYGLLAQPPDHARYTSDVTAALARLHPGDEPWDFVGAGYAAVGDPERSQEALRAGYARDCEALPEGASRKNCDAWYWALGGERLDDAERRITEALAEAPSSAAFLDTAAVVALAAGRRDEAIAHARSAALQLPDDAYTLWQLSRVSRATLAAPESP